MTVPRILPRAEHPISRGYVDPDALRVLYRLHRSGFKGYLVGGSVRDLMSGRTPKDFDVGTDARPNEIRNLFRNSRVIGRRFKLVHVFFDGGKVVEVSTFRRRPQPLEDEEALAPGADLLIREDNVFGSPEEDALRRDFTINGLFYDIATFAVLDYVGGVDDLASRVVRTIGDPVIRFREDPVRMLRAGEFAARMEFEMTPDVVEAIAEVKGEIRKSAAPRVAEELLEPLRRGWGAGTYRIWAKTGLLGELLPELDAEVGPPAAPASPGRVLFWKMLADVDRRRAAGERLPEPALLGVLVLPILLAALRRGAPAGAPVRAIDPTRLFLALDDVVNPLALRLSWPNHAVHVLKQALFTMGRLAETRPDAPGARRLVSRSTFPVALALLSLYASASNRYQAAAAAWDEVQSRGGRPAKGTDDGLPPFPEALLPPTEAGRPLDAALAAEAPRKRRPRAERGA